MGTSYQTIIDAFYRRIEKDREFFNYFNLTDAEALALAKERSLSYMDEALARITLECQPSVDFSNRDDTTEIFGFNLSKTEIFLVSSLMYQSHLERDITYLKTLNVNYTSTELRVFDPSNARSTFMDMYRTVCDQNETLMDKYKNIDRVTGTYKTVNFNAYDDSE